MGCRSLWKFLANKKHQPSIRYHRHLAKGLQECRVRHASTNTNNKVRVDVMGSIFSTIQYAYTHCSREAAHALVHKRLKKLANPLISVLYFDGDPTTEKESTHDERAKVRRKAEELADEKINEFEVRINNGQRIRKQHFIGIQKQLSRTFQWSSEDRLSLIDYLRDHQWIVQLSPYEADVHIADDCAPGDIVISGDSDLIIHPTVTTVWRPISGSRFLEYIVDEVLAVLGIGRPQLVTLGVVSHNDYNKNIYGLGCATNYKIIKDLPKAETDVPKLVAAYLADSRVVIKNTDHLDFRNSIRVFVQRLQEGVKALPDLDAHSGNRLRTRFDEAKKKYQERKKSEVAATLTKKRALVDHPRRHKRSQQYNRYRTIDQPPPTDVKQGNVTAIRTRPRYSPKRRSKSKKHAPPKAMTLYKWKAWKKKPETPDDTSTTTDAKIKELKPRKYVPPKNKLELLRSLSREHPIVSLDVGTLRANVRSALKVKVEPTSNDGAGLPDKATPTIGNGSLVEVGKAVGLDMAVEAGLTEASTVQVEAGVAERVEVANAVVACLRGAARQACKVKRRCQGIFGRYIERVTVGEVSPADRRFLDFICPSIPSKDLTSTDGANQKQDDDDHKLDQQEAFISCFMRYLYSGKTPAASYTGASTASSGKASKVGQSVMEFITRLKQLKILESRDQALMKDGPEYTPASIVRSVATQLAVELKRIYHHGTYELQEQLKAQWDRDQKAKQEASGLEEAPKAEQKAKSGKHSTTAEKDTAQDSKAASVDKELLLKMKASNGAESSKKVATVGPDLEIHRNWSAIENFLRFNRRSSNPRRVVPMSSQEDRFVSFSEKEILAFFWGRPILQAVLREFTSAQYPSGVALDDLYEWLGKEPPGYLIKLFLSNIDPKGLTKRQRGKAGYRGGAIKLMSVAEIKQHLSSLRPQNPTDFKPDSYTTKGYLLHGSVRCDGFRIQLMAFKLRELLCVKYRQLPEDQLPLQLTSTVGGLDFYLTEIRNIVKTESDVERLWPNVDPNEIKVLCIDLGQAFVVGGCALLSDSFITVPCDKMVLGTSDETPSSSASLTSASSSTLSTDSSSSATPTTTVVQPNPAFYNLSVSQKAVSQPTFKHRRWMEDQKKIVPQGAQESIADIESELPPLRGKDANVDEYLEVLEQHHDRLDAFYNGDDMRFKRHGWDAKRARVEEFNIIANRLLGLVGGSIGAKRKDDNHVIIGIGLGQFTSKGGLSSLHETFLSFFVQLARSLGYLVVGVNEFYTSKKCPTCGEFVCQVNLRRLYCQTCQAYMHRDIMAGHNMCNIVKTHLLTQTRPLYLQPIDEEGHYPWMEDGESNRIDAGTSRGLPSQNPKDKAETVGPTQRVSKRKSTDDSMPGDGSVRQDKKRKAVTDSNPRVSQSRGPRKRSQVKKDTR